MKYLSKITLGLILCTGIITSCKDDDETGIPGGIAIDREEITIGAEGGTEKVAVSSHASWVASASKPWIAVSPANGLGSAECSLAIDSTLENTSRTAQVRFSLEGQEPKMITVTQFGYGKQILIKEPNVEIENSALYDKRYFEATISTNVNFKISETVDYSFANAENMSEEEKADLKSEKDGWLTMPKANDLKVNLDRKARPRTIKVRFRWNSNMAPYARVAKIHLVPQNPEEDQLVDNDGNPIKEVILTVTQKQALKIEDNRSGDSLAIIAINQKLQSMATFDTSENMQNWTGVTLWESTDEGKGLPSEEAIGRVRSVTFSMFNLKDGETMPKEVRYLKYLESITIQSNENRQIRDVSLGEEICELKYLKNLTAFAYGIVKLPENFAKLGGKEDDSYVGLEKLNLTSNNFAKLSDVTDVVNQTNFPKLKVLDLSGCRRVDMIKDLSEITADGMYNGKEVGMHINLTKTDDKNAFIKLLTWDKLIELSLSYNYIEGTLPTDDEMETALGAKAHYTEDDFFEKDELTATPSLYLDKISKDTCQWLLTDDNQVTFTQANAKGDWTIKGKDVLRVLPKARKFSFNLNFLTGSLPKWILFHPYFVTWNPDTFIFTQEDDAKNSSKDEKVNVPGFDNIDNVKFDYTYYYGDKDPGKETTVSGVAYPLYYRKYVANASSDTTD